ncbi:MAG: glycosyltransferase family 2 protein [Pseudomonadota bacterium]
MTSISCIITSYNNQEFLCKAVISVISQTMFVDEIIIADDCSTDNSRELITSLAGKYHQIRPIFREKNLGVAANRDLAIRAANGDLVTTLDGDDFYLPQKIEKEYAAMQNNSCLVAYSDILLVNHEGKDISFKKTSKFSLFNEKDRLNWLASRLGHIPRDMLFTKQLYLEVDGMNHQIPVYEDWDFKIRLAAQPSKWAYSGVKGTAYRQTGSGLSSMNSRKLIKDQFEVLWLNRDLLEKHIGQLGVWKSFARLFARGGFKTFRGLKNKFIS